MPLDWFCRTQLKAALGDLGWRQFSILAKFFMCFVWCFLQVGNYFQKESTFRTWFRWIFQHFSKCKWSKYVLSVSTWCDRLMLFRKRVEKTVSGPYYCLSHSFGSNYRKLLSETKARFEWFEAKWSSVWSNRLETTTGTMRHSRLIILFAQQTLGLLDCCQCSVIEKSWFRITISCFGQRFSGSVDWWFAFFWNASFVLSADGELLLSWMTAFASYHSKSNIGLSRCHRNVSLTDKRKAPRELSGSPMENDFVVKPGTKHVRCTLSG